MARGAALLLQRNGGRQALDAIDIWNSRLIDETPRVWADRFEVSPLRLGEQGSKGERGLSRARDAGENDQAIARNIDVYILEIVISGAAHAHERRRIARWILHDPAS